MNKNLADHFPSDHLESVLSVQEIHCKDQPKKKMQIYISINYLYQQQHAYKTC